MSRDALIAHRRRMGMIPSSEMPPTRDDDCGCGGGKSLPRAQATRRAPVKRSMVRCSSCNRLISTTKATEGYQCPLCERSSVA